MDTQVYGIGNSDPMCVEGSLSIRAGRTSGRNSLLWKRKLVFLDFANGGSLKIFNQPLTKSLSIRDKDESDIGTPPDNGKNQSQTLRGMYSRFHRRLSTAIPDTTTLGGSQILEMYIPASLDWTAKDVAKTTATFVIQVPSTNKHAKYNMSSRLEEPSMQGLLQEEENVLETDLQAHLAAARKKGVPFTLYFRCNDGGNEKAVWLEAFQKLDRLSDNFGTGRPNLFRALTQMRRSRQRKDESGEADNADHVSVVSGKSESPSVGAHVEEVILGKPSAKHKNQEFKVLPPYAYPNRWLTISELYDEMMKPSSHFHDLRDPEQRDKEIGYFRVEVLQCVGLPRLDRASDTDAVVYLVCGPHAFATDVIPDRTNPMWLAKTRRACIFPIYNGFARLYVGVFDDDWGTDDFAGRIALDMARLRPDSTYDVTIPLRLSASAYTRRKRGSIRLRFTLAWHSQRDAVLSYLPKKLRLVLPHKSRPSLGTTVPCADTKAFRNVAITVRGVHLPDRFTFPKVRAVFKEISFIRKHLIAMIKQELWDLRQWTNPVMSALVFLAWMHCIYRNSFALVPAYAFLFAFVQMLRNYAVFVYRGQGGHGFLQPTFEEMLGAVTEKTEGIEPLFFGFDEEHDTDNRDTGIRMEEIEYKSSTHEPRGGLLFKMLGFIPWDYTHDGRNPYDTHLEFPLADPTLYPKRRVKDCLADREFDATDVPDQDVSGLNDYDAEEGEFQLAGLGMRLRAKDNNNNGALTPKTDGSVPQHTSGSSLEHEDSDNMSEEDLENASQEGDQSVKSAVTVAAWPDQNLDEQGPRSSKKLTDDLVEAQYKIHDFTWHHFDDRNYTIKHPEASFFGDSQKKWKKRKGPSRVRKKLDKLLQVGHHSNANPVLNRLGMYVEPLIASMQSFILCFRASFNAFTWQDPYLSFWLFLFVGATTLILFFFPWRIFMFAAGIALVGPQNYIIRILRARGLMKPKQRRKRNEDEIEEWIPAVGQTFHSHIRVDGLELPDPPEEPDQREVHHIVIPYGPLMYQRFYDWPPEREFSYVVPKDHHMRGTVHHQKSVHYHRLPATGGGRTKRNTGVAKSPIKRGFSSFFRRKKDKSGKNARGFGSGSSAGGSTVETLRPLIEQSPGVGTGDNYESISSRSLHIDDGQGEASQGGQSFGGASLGGQSHLSLGGQSLGGQSQISHLSASGHSGEAASTPILNTGAVPEES